VVRSWLLDLLVAALEEDQDLSTIEDWVDDSGEGRWTVDEAIDLAVPLPVISAGPAHLVGRFRGVEGDVGLRSSDGAELASGPGACRDARLADAHAA
jgi:6-phosphogluconate dehydrogenase (decarboxylating)